MPALLAVGLVVWQLILVGHTAWISAHAARAAARATWSARTRRRRRGRRCRADSRPGVEVETEGRGRARVAGPGADRPPRLGQPREVAARRRWRPRREARDAGRNGQAALELLGALPVLLVLGLALRAAAGGRLRGRARGECRRGGRASRSRRAADAEASVRERAAGLGPCGSASVRVAGGRVTVRLRPPSLMAALARKLEVASTASVASDERPDRLEPAAPRGRVAGRAAPPDAGDPAARDARGRRPRAATRSSASSGSRADAAPRRSRVRSRPSWHRASGGAAVVASPTRPAVVPLGSSSAAAQLAETLAQLGRAARGGTAVPGGVRRRGARWRRPRARSRRPSWRSSPARPRSRRRASWIASCWWHRPRSSRRWRPRSRRSLADVAEPPVDRGQPGDATTGRGCVHADVLVPGFACGRAGSRSRAASHEAGWVERSDSWRTCARAPERPVRSGAGPRARARGRPAHRRRSCWSRSGRRSARRAASSARPTWRPFRRRRRCAASTRACSSRRSPAAAPGCRRCRTRAT